VQGKISHTPLRELAKSHVIIAMLILRNLGQSSGGVARIFGISSRIFEHSLNLVFLWTFEIESPVFLTIFPLLKAIFAVNACMLIMKVNTPLEVLARLASNLVCIW
jgi:predicted metallopeptidase